MNGLDICLVIMGIYFLISAYLIIFKDVQLTILMGLAYRDVRLITDRTVINKKLGKVTFITGIIIVLVSLINSVINIVVYYEILYLTLMYFIIGMCIIVWKIKKGRYS